MQTTSTVQATATQLWRFRFGTAEFDEARFELRVAGLQVDVQRKPLEILNALLIHAGEIVTKEELLETVWEGRPTVENVVANAMTKLRNALGNENARHIATQPRVGYKLVGVVERTAVGRSLSSGMELKTGEPVPSRNSFQLVSLLGASKHNEVWIARHSRTKEARVYKFATSGERLGALKRETTLSRLIQDALGARDDFVKVLDWNFETPPFFLECEYGGESLDQWAVKDDRLRSLNVAERVALFLQIAQTVQAAHEVGVLHKDLKPANILIAPKNESAWQIRLTDFGSGKLLDPERLAELGITRLGMTLTTAIGDSDATGTLLYLAPELIARETPTIKTDIYALGIVLYQIVVGDLRKPMVSGWQRQVDDELLREDIAAATDGDPQHRLSSVAELIDRLQRLEARTAERERQRREDGKSAAIAESAKRQRMRRPWIAATIGALVLAIVVGSNAYYRLNRSQNALAQQHDITQRLNSFLTRDLIGAANPVNGGRLDVTVVEAARAAAKHIDPEFGSSNVEVSAALHEAMQKTFTGLSDGADAIDEGRKALRDYQRLKPPNEKKIRMLQVQMASLLTSGSAYADAKAILDELNKAYGNEGDDDEFYARLHIARARLDIVIASWQEAVAELDQARTLVASPALEALRDEVDKLQAHAYRTTDQAKKAEALLRDLIARQTNRSGASSVEVNNSNADMAATLVYDHRPDEAEPFAVRAVDNLTKIFPPNNPRVLYARAALAKVQYNQRKFAEAAANWRELFEVTSGQDATERERSVSYGANLGFVLHKMKNATAAERAFRDSLKMARTYLPETDALIHSIRFMLADCLLDTNRPAEAAQLLQGVTAETVKRTLDLRDPESWLAYESGRIALQTGNPTEALTQFSRGLQLLADEEPDTDIDGEELEPSLREGVRRAKAALRVK